MSATGPGAGLARPRDLLEPTGLDLAVAAAVAGAVLAATSTGSLVVVALLVWAATLDRRSGVAVLVASLATSVRFTTGTLDDLAGIQSVLGIAGEVGPPAAAASAWLGAAAVLLATRAPAAPGGDRDLRRFAPALATGTLAAALVAGPGPDQLALRVATSLAGVAVAVSITVLQRRRDPLPGPALAIALGTAALVLGAWPA